MNIVLWVLQGVLAGMFAGSAAIKLGVPRDKLIQKMPWANDFEPGQIKLIGLVELLGAVGLVVPWATHILPILTPLAGIGLALVMAGAVWTHVRRKESLLPSVILGPLVLVVALGRLDIF